MSQANLEIVRALYEAVSRHDTEAVLSAYDPDVESISPGVHSRA